MRYKWLWLCERDEFIILGNLSNSRRKYGDPREWVIIQSTTNGRLWEVLKGDLSEA